jgi:hypothetical protein
MSDERTYETGYKHGYARGKSEVTSKSEVAASSLAELLALPAFKEAVEWAKNEEAKAEAQDLGAALGGVHDLSHVGAEIHAKWSAEEMDTLARSFVNAYAHRTDHDAANLSAEVLRRGAEIQGLRAELAYALAAFEELAQKYERRWPDKTSVPSDIRDVIAKLEAKR